jgi:hypothetical protein
MKRYERVDIRIVSRFLDLGTSLEVIVSQLHALVALTLDKEQPVPIRCEAGQALDSFRKIRKSENS